MLKKPCLRAPLDLLVELRGSKVHRGKSQVLIVVREGTNINMSKLLLNLGPCLAPRVDAGTNLERNL